MDSSFAARQAWYESQFSRPLQSPLDFYRMGRLQFNSDNAPLAVQCLEHFVALSPALEVAPVHLLAHAQLRCGRRAEALECFRACARLGFDEDWQLVVETALDIDREEGSTGAGAGAGAGVEQEAVSDAAT